MSRAWPIVSRGTVYRYFEDRNILIDAAIEFGAQKFYQHVAEAMAKKTTLAEKTRRDGGNACRRSCWTTAPAIG